MPLGFKLIAFGIILLLPKTYLYLSGAPPLEAQSASERQISTLVVHWDVSSTGHLTVSAAKIFKCGESPEHDGSDTVAIHAMNKSLKGS